MTYVFVDKYLDKERTSLLSFLSGILGRKISLEELFSNPDIHNLLIEEKDSIGIEDAKNFQREMMYRPFQESFQIGIIHNSEKLTIEAQNALLKTLEETSKFSIYILCVNNERNLLPTIRSRARIIYNNSLDKEIPEITTVLEEDLLTKFEMIEDAYGKKESAIDFINSVEEVLRAKFEINIKNGNIDGSKRDLESLRIVQKSRDRIVANCNRRLTLESMIIQLET